MIRLTAVFSSLLFFFATIISAQSLNGEWVDESQQLKVTLHHNGTFLFSGPEENLVGNYGLEGNQLVMIDTHGRSHQFAVRDGANNRKILVDPRGNALVYRRANGKPGLRQKSRDLLAEYGSFQLKQADINTGLAVIQFITEQPVQSDDKDIFIRASIYEFGKSPGPFLAQVNALRKTLTQIRQLSNPLDIGKSRQQLLSSFYATTRQLHANDQPTMMQIIGQYVKFLAFSEPEQLVLTDHDVDAIIQYVAFLQKMTGGKPEHETSERKKFAESLITLFPSMTSGQKRFITSAGICWQSVDHRWKSLNLKQQREFRNRLSKHRLTHSVDRAVVPAEMQAYKNMYSYLAILIDRGHSSIIDTFDALGQPVDYWQARKSNAD